MKKLLFLFVLPFFLGCSDDDNTYFEPIPITQFQMGKGYTNGIEIYPNEYTVITNLDEFSTFYEVLLANNPTSNIDYGGYLDFDTYTVIAVVDHIGGPAYRTIDIISVYEHEDKIIVTIDCLSPGTAHAVSNTPYHIIRIEKPSKPIIFEDLRY